MDNIVVVGPNYVYDLDGNGAIIMDPKYNAQDNVIYWQDMRQQVVDTARELPNMVGTCIVAYCSPGTYLMFWGARRAIPEEAKENTGEVINVTAQGVADAIHETDDLVRLSPLGTVLAATASLTVLAPVAATSTLAYMAAASGLTLGNLMVQRRIMSFMTRGSNVDDEDDEDDEDNELVEEYVILLRVPEAMILRQNLRIENDSPSVFSQLQIYENHFDAKDQTDVRYVKLEDEDDEMFQSCIDFD